MSTTGSWRRFLLRGSAVAVLAVLLGVVWHYFGPVWRVTPPRNVVLISWEEHPARPSSIASYCLTIWSDGRSEVVVTPTPPLLRLRSRMHLRPGWVWHDQTMVKLNALDRTQARLKFEAALGLGMHLLRSEESPSADPGATSRADIMTLVEENNRPISACFAAEDLTPHPCVWRNLRRFWAIQRVLADFDRQAFDMIPPSTLPANRPEEPRAR